MIIENSLLKSTDTNGYGVLVTVLILCFVIATPSIAQTEASELQSTTDSTEVIEDSLTITSPLSLSFNTYEVVDTSEYITFRLHVRNSSDSLGIIDRVEPSCGCILATIQRSFIRKEKDGEIYIGLSTKRMSDTQPYTVDVYTTMNPDSPMRLYIRKKKEQSDE